MRNILIICVAIYLSASNIWALGNASEDTVQDTILYDLNKLRAATYLNECAYSLTRIIKSDNKIILLNEQDKLNNIYRWENVTDFPSVVEFRSELQYELNDLIINETNKERFKKQFEKKQNALARDAFLNAISGVQINVNVYSTVANVLVTSARAYLDYGKRKDDITAELDEELWGLEQYRMNTIANLRNGLFNIIQETFGRYGLSDNMFLREAHFDQFFNILANKNRKLRLASLEENSAVFQAFSPYWFELGCAYIDNYELNNDNAYLEKAWNSFDTYKQMTEECPMFLVDERLGMIALYQLKFLENLTNNQILQLIDTVRSNISNDSSALLYAALLYSERLGKPDTSLNMMRQCLDNKSLTGKDEFILAAASIWNKTTNNRFKDLFIEAVSNTDNIDLNTYISFLYKIQQDKSVDIYPLLSKLRSSLGVVVHSYDGDMIESFAVESKNLNSFQYDSRLWNISLIDNNLIAMDAKSYPSNISFAEPKLFFSSVEKINDKLKSSNEYFAQHPNHLEKAGIISRTMLNNSYYYYIPAQSTWEKLSSEGAFPYMDNAGDKTKKYDQRANIENEYVKFHNKYKVDNIRYLYNIDSPVTINFDSKSRFPRYRLIVTVLDYETTRIDLVFTTDYIEEEATEFYFDSVIYNGEYICM